MANNALETRPLGKSGIDVTRMGIGLWAIGGSAWGPVEDKNSLDTIDAALDAGITFFDTADVYGDGHSEELLAQAMQGRRDRFIVGTKIGWRNFDREKNQTAYDTVEKLIAGVESNLRRLNTDYVDLIQSHISYYEPTMTVFLEGFQRLQRDGKVRAYGVRRVILSISSGSMRMGAVRRCKLTIAYSTARPKRRFSRTASKTTSA